MTEKKRFVLLIALLLFQIAFILFTRYWYERVFN